MNDRKTIKIEDIQDIIEQILLKLNFKEVHDAYKEYREHRAASREAFTVKQQHKFVKAIESLGLKTAKEENSKRENANVDGDGPMGTMFTFLRTTVSKEFAKAHSLDNKFSRAHDDGYIHVHELDFFTNGNNNLYANRFK